MEGLQISFLLKASLLQSKTAFLVCCLPLLLVLLFAFPPLKSTLMPTIWHALPGLLEEPSLAFLLLNCVTLTIIASSKLGSEKKGHQEEGQGQVAMKLTEKGDEKGDDIVETVIGLSFYLDLPVENGYQKGDDVVESVVRPGLYIHTPFKTCLDFSESKGGNFLRRCWSLNGSFEYKPKHEHIKLAHVKKEKRIKPTRSRGRLGSRKTDKVGIHPNMPLSAELQKKQLARGSLTSSDGADSEGPHPDHEKPVLKDDNCDSTREEQCVKGCCERAGSATDQGTQQAAGNPAPAAGDQAEHPSMDEVWAAIMLSKRSDGRMAASLQARKRSKKSKPKAVKQPQPITAAANPASLAAAAAAVDAPPAAATAATKSPSKVPNWATKATVAKKHVQDRNGGTEVEQLNHRADEFIERFNRQIRIQREESLEQRQMKIRGRRACNYHDVQHSRKPPTSALPVPPRGLLVG